MLKQHAVYYAAFSWDIPVGIFDCEQKAQNTGYFVRELPAVILEGTAPKEGYLLYIAATASMLTSTPEGLVTTETEIAPVCGVNAQSAVYAIVKVRGAGMKVHPKNILLYEINRLYPPEERRAPGVRAAFSHLFRPCSEEQPLSGEFLAADYIGLHLQQEEEDRLYREKRRRMESCEEVGMLAEYILTSGGEKTPGCGFAASKTLERITSCLIRYFSLKELCIAAHMLSLKQDPSIETEIRQGAIPQESLSLIAEKLLKIKQRFIH